MPNHNPNIVPIQDFRDAQERAYDTYIKNQPYENMESEDPPVAYDQMIDEISNLINNERNSFNAAIDVFYYISQLDPQHLTAAIQHLQKHSAQWEQDHAK